MLSTLIFSAVLTVFSAAILLYVSLATGLGPWIGPMIVMMVRLGGSFSFKRLESRTIALITITASFGGAIATGIGFSLPTLYFIDPALWASWMAAPLWFCALMAVLVLSAGILGIRIAKHAVPALLHDATPFPVSAAVTSAIASSYGPLEAGIFGGGILCAMATGCANYFWALGLSPVCWAAGFLAGTSIVMPMLVGMAGKYVVVAPLGQCYPALSTLDVTFALCSGLLVSSFIKPFVYHPMRSIVSLRATTLAVLRKTDLWSGVLVAGLCYYFNMSLAGVCFFAIILVPLLRHLGDLAAHTGLATYGRYMTIAMIPLMCIPGVSGVSVVIACTLIGIAGGVLVDSLFSYKIAQQCGIDEPTLRRAQYYGVAITAMSIGVLIWLLCTHFTLGVSPLIDRKSVV